MRLEKAALMSEIVGSIARNYLIARVKLSEESFLAYSSGRLDEEIWQTELLSC
jgi:hypothetical protein